jgi:hypothetical protein
MDEWRAFVKTVKNLPVPSGSILISCATISVPIITLIHGVGSLLHPTAECEVNPERFLRHRNSLAVRRLIKTTPVGLLNI